MVKYLFYFVLLIFLIHCKSETEKFNDLTKNHISSTLKENEKIIYFENIKNDSLSQREIDNFVANYAFQGLTHFHKEQQRIGSTIKNMDSAKTPEGIKKIQEDFSNKMKIVSDSFQYYSKITDIVIDSKASQKKIIRYADYKMTIEDKITGKRKDIAFTAFVDGHKIFDTDAFFRYQVRKFKIK